MCRWIAYRGETIPLEQYVTAPAHSLVVQSLKAFESTASTNGDGFGMGWYGEHPQPARLPTTGHASERRSRRAQSLYCAISRPSPKQDGAMRSSLIASYGPEREAVDLYRRAGGGAVQAGALSVLSGGTTYRDRRQAFQSTDSECSTSASAISIRSENRTKFRNWERALGTIRPSKPRKKAASATACVRE
jgi:hypothetical protein